MLHRQYRAIALRPQYRRAGGSDATCPCPKATPSRPSLTSRLQSLTIFPGRRRGQGAGTHKARGMRNLRDFITIRQAADMIGVSPATLRNWDRSGKLKAIRNPVNRYRLYRPEDIEAFLARVISPEGSLRTEPPSRAREGRRG